jgi:hypothetical protein
MVYSRVWILYRRAPSDGNEAHDRHEAKTETTRILGRCTVVGAGIMATGKPRTRPLCAGGAGATVDDGLLKEYVSQDGAQSRHTCPHRVHRPLILTMT